MNRLRRAVFVIVVAGMTSALLALTGCATAVDGSPSLFVLDNGPTPHAGVPNSRLASIMVAPVTTASYLNQGGIVYQTAPYRIVVANDNRWASPLDRQLSDTLYNVLSRRLRDANILRPTGNQRGVYVLNTRVDKFYGSHDGNAHISGTWSLTAPNGHIVGGDNFDRSVRLDTDGYPALISALSTGWQNVAADMAPTLAQQIVNASASPESY